MNRVERDTLHECWIITADPDVMAYIREMRTDEIRVAEQAKHGTEAMFYVEYIGVPNESYYEFLVTLDALLAMGARVYGMLPRRKSPSENN